MAERAKSKKKAKAKTATKGLKGKPGVGHNSGGVSPALVKTHHEKLDGIEDRLAKTKTAYDKVKGEHRAAYAVVKQDGIDVDALKLARQLHKEDHGIVVTTYAKVGDYLAAIKSELATQMDLFQSLEIQPPKDAAMAGVHAFKNKEPRSNNPYKQGTEEYVSFDNAWMAEGGKVDLNDTAEHTEH